MPCLLLAITSDWGALATWNKLFGTENASRSAYEILDDRDSQPCRKIFATTMIKTGLVLTKDFTDTADQEIGSRVDVRQRRQYQQINSHLSPLHTIRILKRAPGTKFLNLAPIFFAMIKFYYFSQQQCYNCVTRAPHLLY